MKKSQSKIPPEIQALAPNGHLLNETRKGVYQTYIAKNYTDPETKKRRQKRTYTGQIKDNVFTYTPGYLLKMKEEELRRKEEELASLKAAQAISNVPNEERTEETNSKSSVNEADQDGNKSGISTHETELAETNVITAGTGVNQDSQTDAKAAELKEKMDWRPYENATKVLEIARTMEDDRQKAKVVYQIDHVLLVALLSALGGSTSCVAIADYWCDNRCFLEKTIPDFPAANISHDTVRRLLMICNPDRLEAIFRKMVEPLIELVAWRTVAVDGQAVRASGTRKHPRYVLNFYDTVNGVAIGQKLVGDKTNETTVAPTMIADLDLRGAIVTCDALNTRCDFARDLMLAGADYCMAVKRNWRQLLRGIKACFDNADAHEIRTLSDTSTEHGRNETRTIAILPASKLSKKLLERWFGLSEGCIVKTTTEIINKSTGKVTSQDRYFVTSLRYENPNIVEQCATSIRRHWGVENELHYVLDVNFHQDRTQCKNANYLMNRVRLNQLAHAIVNKIRSVDLDSNGKLKSRKRVMNSLATPERALEKLGAIYRN